MFRPRIAVVLTFLTALAVAASAPAATAPQVSVSLSPSKVKATSTITLTFAAPYAIGSSPVPETYRADVNPPGKCKNVSAYGDAPNTAGSKVKIRLAPKKTSKAKHWCKGTYKLEVVFEADDSYFPPGSPEDDAEEDGSGFGVKDVSIFKRTFKVR